MCDWNKYLSELETAIEATPNAKGSDFGRIQACLDRLLDEIKSGEKLSHEERLRLIALFERVLHFPNWNLLQVTCIGYCHVFYDAGASIDSYLTGERGLLPTLLALVSNHKREVRDAVGQAFGALSSVMGDAVFNYLLAPFSTAVSSAEAWEVLEGHMISIGYAVSKCPSISASNFSALTKIVYDCSHNEKYHDFSNYVRLQALKALERIVKSSRVSKLLDPAGEEASKLVAIIFERLNDNGIDVRRAAARVHTAWFSHCISFASAESSTSVMDSAVQQLLDALSKSTRWENRHGLNLAFTNLCSSSSLVALLSTSTFQTLVDTLIAQVRFESPKSTGHMGDVASSANAAAGTALSQLLITKYTPSSVASASSSSLESAMASLSVSSSSFTQEEALAFYEKYVHVAISFMLKSFQPTLLDCGGQCVQRLYSALPSFMESSMPELVSLMFKNQFHASMPVRDAAIRMWRASCERSGGSAVYMASVTPVLIGTLLENVAVSNSEVRETVFKGLDEVFSQPTPPALLLDLQNAAGFVETLLKGALNTVGGDSSEYPRSAALGALSSLMRLLSTSEEAKSNEAFTNGLFAHVLPIVATLLAADSEMVIVAALNLVATLAKSWASIISQPARTAQLAVPIIVSAHHSLETVRFTAVPVLTALLGDVNEAITSGSAGLMEALGSGFTGRFGMTEDANDEEENREAVARALLFVTSLPGFATASNKCKEPVLGLFSAVLQGLLREENRDSDIIQARCTGALLCLARTDAFRSFLAERPAIMRWTRAAILYAFAVIGGRASDFEIEDEDDFAAIVEPVDEEEEEEEDDEDVYKMDPYKMKVDEVNTTDMGVVRALLQCEVVKNLMVAMKPEQQQTAAMCVQSLFQQCMASSEGYQSVGMFVIRSMGAPIPAVTGPYPPSTAARVARMEELSAAVASFTASSPAVAAEQFMRLASFVDISAEEAEDEEEARLYLLSAPGCDFDIFSPNAVTIRAEQAVDAFLSTHASEVLDSLISFIDTTIRARVGVHALDAKKEAEAIEDDEEALARIREETATFKRVLYLIGSCVDKPYWTSEQRAKLVDVASSVALTLKEVCAIQPEYFYLWRLVSRAVALLPMDELRSHRGLLDKMIAICSSKWFRHYNDGRAAVLVCVAAARFLPAFTEDQPLRAAFLQLLSDLMHDEDLGESKGPLFAVLQSMPEVLNQKPFVLPPPTAVSVHSNETFSRFA